MKKLILFFLLCCSSITCYSETLPKSHKVDSLLNLYKKAETDSSKARLLLEIGSAHTEYPDSTSLGYLNEALSLSIKIDRKDFMGTAYLYIAVYYTRKDLRPEAADNYMKSLDYLQDTSLIIGACGSLSTIYSTEKNYDQAIKYADKAIDISNKTNNSIDKARAKFYLGNVYRTRGYTIAKGIPEEDKNRAMAIFNEGLELLKNDTSIKADKIRMLLYSSMSMATSDAELGLDYSLRAKAIIEKRFTISSYNRQYSAILHTISEKYFNLAIGDKSISKKKKKEYLTLAEKYTMESFKIMDKMGIIYNKSDVYLLYSLIKKEQGEYKEAMESYEKFYQLRDSLFSQQNKNALAAIESKKEIQIRDQHIMINELQIDAQRKQRWIYFGSILLLVIITILLIQQNQSRKKINKELARSNEIKTRFLGILNHDLRQPVAGLISYLELKRMSPDLIAPEDAVKYEHKAIEKAQNLLENMENLLFWCKDQMQSFSPEMKAVSVSSLFEDTKSFFSYCETNQLNFQLQRNLVINTDENYVKTIMRNLTSNALKAIHSDVDGKIVWKAMQKGSFVILEISDNAGGISQELIDSVQKEHRLSSIKGGLGLQIIYDLAKTINCKIKVSSTESGTTFKLFFHLYKP